MSKKILNHVDKEEILKMLNEGVSVRTIEAHFKKKYPNNKSLWLSTVTLQKFRKDNLNLEGKVLKDIQEAREKQNRMIDENVRQRQLEATNAYQEKISKIAGGHLDVSSKILQLSAVVEDKIEYWYNMAKSGEEIPAKADHELRKFIDQQVIILQQYKKLVEGMADKTIDYNVNVTVMNDQIGIIRDAIREAIAEELGAEKAILFMDRLSKKLKGASYRQNELPSIVDLKKLKEAEFELLAEDDVEQLSD